MGQSTSFNVIQFQRDLEQARSTALVAGGNYEKAKAALDRAMGRTLATNGVKFDEGLSGIVSRPEPLPRQAQSRSDAVLKARSADHVGMRSLSVLEKVPTSEVTAQQAAA